MEENVKFYLKKIDWLLLLFLSGVLLAGFLTVKSVSSIEGATLASKQLLWYTLGFISMFILAFLIDYRILKKIGRLFYAFCIFLLILVMFVSHGKVHRWIHIGLFSIQPSEFTKLAIILILSDFFSTRIKECYTLKDIFLIGCILIIPLWLIKKQPDLGTAVLIAIVSATIIFFARLNLKTIIVIIISVIVALPLFYHSMLPYQRQRLEAFLHPDKYKQQGGYHINESKIAVGTGGKWGQGFKKGVQVHLKFLPESHTDFAFATFAEEWGFWGCCLLIICYLGIFWRGLTISRNARDRFGTFLAFGITALLFWQTFINMIMVLGWAPVVGIPLPLVSYGGSSALVTLSCIGILLNIYKNYKELSSCLIE